MLEPDEAQGHVSLEIEVWAGSDGSREGYCCSTGFGVDFELELGGQRFTSECGSALERSRARFVGG